jgi:hypothetical protein
MQLTKLQKPCLDPCHSSAQIEIFEGILSFLVRVSRPALSSAKKIIFLCFLCIASPTYGLNIAVNLVSPYDAGGENIKNADGTLLPANALFKIGTFVQDPDTNAAAIAALLSPGNVLTNLNNTSNFLTFGTAIRSNFVDGILNFDYSLGGNLAGKSIFLIAYNNNDPTLATQVGIYRFYDAAEAPTKFLTPEGLDNEFFAVLLLESDPDNDFFATPFFGNLSFGNTFLSSVAGGLAITSGNPPATVKDQAYSYTITSNNGATSYYATGLPNGLDVDSATGVISGAPSVTGTFSVTLRANNPLFVEVTKVVTLTVNAPVGLPPAITPVGAQTAYRGVPFSLAVSASNDPTGFTLSGAPVGFSISALGVVAGTTTEQTGTYTLSIRASGAGGTSDPQLVTLTLANPTITPSQSSVNGAVGSAITPVTFTVVPPGSSPSYDRSSLPDGLTLNFTTGTITGTPTATATSSSTVTATFSSGVTAQASIAFNIRVLPVLLAPSPEELEATRGQEFSLILQRALNGAVGPFTYEQVSGVDLSTIGLNLQREATYYREAGVIYGTPTMIGVYSASFRVYSSIGASNILPITITIDPGTPVLPVNPVRFRLGQSLSQSSVEAQLGLVSDNFYIAANPPPGVINNAPLGSGFSGTPTVSGNFQSTITAFNTKLSGARQETSGPVQIRINRGTQAFYGMDGNLDGGPAGRALTGQVAGYFPDRFERPNSSVKVSTGSGLVHSNPQTEVVDQFSLSLWFKMPETPIPAGGAYLIKGNPSVDAVSIKLIPSTTSSRVRLVLENVKSQYPNDNSGLFSGNQFTTPEIEGWSAGSGWHHIVFSSTEYKEIYLDGVGLSRLGDYHRYFSTAPLAFDLNNFSIGGNPWSVDNAPFAGEIDEVGVYDIPLEETDLSLVEFFNWEPEYNPLGDPTVESLYLHGLANAGGGKLTVFGYHLETAFLWNRIVDLDVGMFTVSGLDSNGRPMLFGAWHEFRRSTDGPSLGVPPPSIVSEVAELRSGSIWHLALKKDAKAYYVGFGSYGDLNLITPHEVSLKSTSAVALAAGLNHAMILKTDGSLDVWHPITEPSAFYPEPEAFHLGQTSVPVAATHLVAIAAGWNHCVALDREGRVLAWGDNSNGQCDVPIAAQSNIVKIAAGGDLSMALTRDGRVLFWGLQDVAVGSPDAFQGKYRFIDVEDNGSLGALTEDGRLVTWLRGNVEIQRYWDAIGISQLLPAYGGFSGISRFKMGGWTLGYHGTEFPVILQANNVPSWKMNFPLKLIGRPGIPFSFELSSVADLPSGQTHRFEAIGLPYGVVLDPASGILSAPNGLPTQGQTVTFVVRNDNGLDRRSVSLQAEDPVGIQLLACNPQESQNTVLLATLRLPAGWQLSPISVVQPYVAREVYGGWEIWSRAGLDYENPQERTVNVSVSATDPLGGAHNTSVEVALLNDPWEDADGDTVREYFEELYGSSDQLADTDGDGVSDWHEIQAGTSPKNPAVRPGSGSATGEHGNGKFRFRFHAGIGKWVTVQSSEDLINWSSETLTEGELVELYPGFEGDGEIWEAEFPISSNKRFYRAQQTNFRSVSR